jgi:regulator of protease activity HflC (stomatin/prohibitin superfamily)
MGSSVLAIFSLIVIGYTVGSVRIIRQGNEALVERLGKHRVTLKPGLNFIVPFLDAVVLEDTLREQTIDVDPHTAITKDNVTLNVDAIIYWRILDLEKTYYAIEDVEFAIKELVVTTLRSEIGKMDLESTFSSRDAINKALLNVLDEATEPWGVKINRVEVQKIDPPQAVIDSMQLQQAAAIKKKAAILEAEANVESMRLLAQGLDKAENRREILNFLLAQRYIDANHKLSESESSKVIFMDPRALTEGLVDLINEGESNGMNN